MLVVVAKDICGILHTVQWVCALSSDVNKISITFTFSEYKKQRTKKEKKERDQNPKRP